MRHGLSWWVFDDCWCFIEKKNSRKNPYFTLNYKEKSGFPGFFPGVFFYECFLGDDVWDDFLGGFPKSPKKPASERA